MVSGIIEHSKWGDLVTKIIIDANLSQEIGKAMNENSKGIAAKDYFYVTELVNPIFAYWSRKVEIINPPEIQSKLIYGKKIHYLSRYWFEKISGVTIAEANLAGAYTGLGNISGKVDYFKGNSIIEFKTKNKEIKSIEDLLENYPQDLEQLLIYSVLSSTQEKFHYLVFSEESGNSQKRNFKAFKIKINDREAIRKFTESRRDLLANAIRDGNWENLPQCRYFESGCKFKESKTCNCARLSPINAMGLLRFIEIEEDQQMANELKAANDSTSSSFDSGDPNYLWNVLLPMKWYHDKFDYYRNEEDYNEESDYQKVASRTAIEAAISKSGMLISGDELKRLSEIDILKVGGYRKYIRAYIPSISSDRLIIPYFIKITKARTIFDAQKLPEIYNAQGVCLAVNSGNKCAAAVVSYTQRNSEVVVYIICADTEKVIRAINVVKSAMDRASHGGASDLPHCLDYMVANCQFDSCACRI